MKRLKVFRTESEEMQSLKAHMQAPNLTIIEAGCGRRWPKELANPTATVIGIDTDPAALALRTDLSEKILDDIRTAQGPTGGADVVYSSFVLEHVQDASKALDNFVRWLKPGGTILLRVPDRDSVWGAGTRLTPLWFHVLWQRWVMGYRPAGTPGYGPYPTYHEPVISRAGIREFCEAHNCWLIEENGVAMHLQQNKWIMLPISLAGWLLSFGRLAWRHSNLQFTIRKLS